MIQNEIRTIINIIIIATTTELTADNNSIILFSAGDDIIVGCTVIFNDCHQIMSIYLILSAINL